jgi:chemotaxis protein MotB
MKRLMVLAIALAASACVSSGKYDAVAKTLKACQESNGSCNQRASALEQQVAEMTAERDKERVAYKETESSLGATRQELDELRRQHAETEKRLGAYQALRQRFQKLVDEKKLSVQVRNGLMILQLPAGVLFASGKATLSQEGQVTVTELGTVLKDMPDRRFLVAGHTDNVPIKGKFRDNWDLSAARAVNVARWLVQQGLPARQIGAAEYSEYDPVADNATPQGRQDNRRIEIVFMPNLEEMLKIPMEGGAAPKQQPKTK